MRVMTSAFVLSGGASLGSIQVGMLLALAEAGIAPDMIVGTSVGAVNGATRTTCRLGEPERGGARSRTAARRAAPPIMFAIPAGTTFPPRATFQPEPGPAAL